MASIVCEYVLQLDRAIQSGASRSSGLQENESGGVDFIIRSVGFASSTCTGAAQADPTLSDESEAEAESAQCDMGPDNIPLPEPSVAEVEAFHKFFVNGNKLSQVRFNVVTKVTPPAQYVPKNRMVHFKKNSRQSKALVLRPAQLDPSVYARAIESEVALVDFEL